MDVHQNIRKIWKNHEKWMRIFEFHRVLSSFLLFGGSIACFWRVCHRYQGPGGDDRLLADVHRFFDTSNEASSSDPYGFDQPLGAPRPSKNGRQQVGNRSNIG